MSFKPLDSSLVALAFAAAVASANPAQAQTARDLSPQQAQVFGAAGQVKPNSLAILTLLDRANATYGIGEVVRLAVKANEDAFVTVFNIGASGKVTQLFPNAFQTDNRVKAGEPLEIPSQASGTQIKVSGPVGAELIKVIATSKPVTIIPDGRFQAGTGIFRSLEGGVDALNRDLAAVAANPAPGIKIAVVNQVIKTVPARVGAATGAGAGFLVVPTPVAEIAGQTFPLLLATDKRSYKVGERLTIGVTPLKPCHLTVYSRDQAGKTRLLFPTSTMPSVAIGSQKTVFVSGGPVAQQVVATGAGIETITALCTSAARPFPVAIRAATDILPEQDRVAFDRDLTVAHALPPETIGIAQLEVTITP